MISKPCSSNHRGLIVHLAFILLLFVCWPGVAETRSAAPSLQEVEAAAIAQAPELKALEALRASQKHAAIAVGQLSDPKLMLSSLNLPTDTFSASQEPMTQLQVGLMQSFPRGRTLAYRSLARKYQAKVHAHQIAMQRLNIKKVVRISWLELYSWLEIRKLVQREKGVFEHLEKVTGALLANNKALQKDVIRAQLEVSQLDNRLLTVGRQIDIARAKLARWIGTEMVKQVKPTKLPQWSFVQDVNLIRQQLEGHPAICADNETILSKKAVVNESRQQFFPGFDLTVAYGARQGNNPMGGKRPDFVSVTAKMDLPLFTKNRQSQDLRSKNKTLLSAFEQKHTDIRALNESLDTHYATYFELSKSLALYQKQLVAQANQYAKATEIAYQNNQTDFPTLARSHISDLETQIAAVKVEVEQYKSRAELLFLEGR